MTASRPNPSTTPATTRPGTTTPCSRLPTHAGPGRGRPLPSRDHRAGPHRSEERTDGALAFRPVQRQQRLADPCHDGLQPDPRGRHPRVRLSMPEQSTAAIHRQLINIPARPGDFVVAEATSPRHKLNNVERNNVGGSGLSVGSRSRGCGIRGNGDGRGDNDDRR